MEGERGRQSISVETEMIMPRVADPSNCVFARRFFILRKPAKIPKSF